MKARILFLAVFFMLVLEAGYAQEKISAKEAGNYIGKTVTVVDTVDQVYKSKKGDYFLDMGKKSFVIGSLVIEDQDIEEI